jgi:hypothetical protein
MAIRMVYKLLFNALLGWLLFSGFHMNAFAQARLNSGMDLSLQGGVHLPVGDSGLVHSGAYGVTLTASLPIAKILDIVAGVGYQKFGTHDVTVTTAGTTITNTQQSTNYPFFAGARFIFDTPTLLPYFGGEFSINDLVYHTTNGIDSPKDVTSTKIGYAILVGTRIPFSPIFSTDATVKYHAIPGETGAPTTTFISLNAGVAIHLNL